MEHLLERILSGNLRLSALDPDLIALEREYSKTDLYALLLVRRRGEATMSQLAADLGVPLSTATGIGNRLYRRGLIRRQRDEEDRRVIVVSLTSSGLQLAEQVQRLTDDMLERVTRALSPEEFAVLVGLVQKILSALQGEAPEAEPQQHAEAEPAARRIPIQE